MDKISISLSNDDRATLEGLVERFRMVRRHTVARAALRAGLDQMLRDVDFAREHLVREVQRRPDAGSGRVGKAGVR